MPFLLSAVVVGVGLWVRAGLVETLDFAALVRAGDLAERPVAESLRQDRLPLVLAVGLRLAENVWGYLVLVFALAYVVGAGHHARDAALVGVSVSILAGLGWYWLAATLADRYGRKPVYLAGTIFGICFAWPFFALLGSPSLAAVWVALLLGWGVASGFSFAIQPAWFAELFGRRTRYTGLSLAFNLATMLSGCTPFIAAALLQRADGRPDLIVALLVALGLLALVSAALAPDTYRVTLSASSSRGARRRR